MDNQEKRKELRQKLETSKDKILPKWEVVWESDQDNNIIYDFFKELFINTYKYVKISEKSNKDNNKHLKILFLRVLIFGYAVYLLLLVTSRKHITLLNLLDNGVILIIVIFVNSIISKWIDIKKYQETWARHSWNLYMMEKEMTLYTLKMDPYNDINKKEAFIKKIFTIWDENENKFVHNMSDKEKELMDVFNKLKP